MFALLHIISWHFHHDSTSPHLKNNAKHKFLQEFVKGKGDKNAKVATNATRAIRKEKERLGKLVRGNGKEMKEMAPLGFRDGNDLSDAENINVGINKNGATGVQSADFNANAANDIDNPIHASPPKNNENNNKTSINSPHPVSGLNCADHGGPTNPKIIDEMIFWSDIPTNSSYLSPMCDTSAQEKYLTFEPDQGGWNNIRMAMETALVMSHAMGRTLVLPPEQRMYLIDKMNDGQKATFSFQDFFHLDAISVEHKGFKVITMEDFLKNEGITGGLKDKITKQVAYPPQNKTTWDGNDRKPLFEYLRQVGNTPEWEPWDCALAIPSSQDEQAVVDLNNTFHSIMDGSYGKPKPKLEEFNGNPTPVNASVADRMREMLADRDAVCIYDKPLQDNKLIHLKVHAGVRLLTHFYAFIFFADWKQDLWSKRFVRDHLRYVDEIVCAAARVVEAVREHARMHNSTNREGIYDAMHVRRGDFRK